MSSRAGRWWPPEGIGFILSTICYKKKAFFTVWGQAKQLLEPWFPVAGQFQIILSTFRAEWNINRNNVSFVLCCLLWSFNHTNKLYCIAIYTDYRKLNEIFLDDYSYAVQSMQFLINCRSSPNGRPCSQAFLAETVKTGDKNRDDFLCMQMNLVMGMRFNFWRWLKKLAMFIIACENIRFSLLFVAGDVLREADVFAG